jgi:hypothetical protein
MSGDIIVVDDISMLPAGQDAKAFCRVTDAAYERRSAAINFDIHLGGVVIS